MMFPKKKWRGKSESKTSYKRLVNNLDIWVSKYIRLRDSDKNGMCRCITCGRIFHWKDGDAGHFVNRNKLATRYDERNVHAQCIKCNRFESGRQAEHGFAIDRLYGKGTAELLVNLGNARGTKLGDLWVKEKITEYKQKVKKILCIKSV